MKKFLIATMLGVTMSLSSFASDATDISSKARYNFRNTYKNVDEVSWSIKAGLNTASFIDKGVFTEVFYDYDGTVVATCKAVSMADLHESAQNTISKRYTDYTVKDIISYTDGTSSYQFISLENDNETVILKIAGSNVSMFKKENK